MPDNVQKLIFFSKDHCWRFSEEGSILPNLQVLKISKTTIRLHFHASHYILSEHCLGTTVLAVARVNSQFCFVWIPEDTVEILVCVYTQFYTILIR